MDCRGREWRQEDGKLALKREMTGGLAQGGDHEEVRSHSTRPLFQRENQQDELMTEYMRRVG